MKAETTAQDVMDVHITFWEPTATDEWSALIQQADHANMAQLPQWFTVIQKAYRHTPLYLRAEDATGQVAFLPAFIVQSRLFGTVITSMPFLDAGGPCSPSTRLARILVDALNKKAMQYGASVIELRCTVRMDMPVPAMQDKVSLVLPLPTDPGCLWRQLNTKVRNQVRKAERSGLTVEFGGVEKLDDFYNVFAVNMRDLGSPVHGRAFFRALFDVFGEKARVALVHKDKEPIGGLIALVFKNTLAVPWASSLQQYLSLCPNMLLYWHTLRMACEEGLQRFDFGRSSRDSGTYRFKCQWGASEEPLFWYTIPVAHRLSRRLSSTDKRGVFLVELWKRLPLNLSRWFGPHIRKYLTQ